VGEMADYYLESADFFQWDEDDGPPAAISCRYCGAGGLFWLEVNNHWRLVTEDKSVHSCGQYRIEKEPK
jgi:hypothetical protein